MGFAAFEAALEDGNGLANELVIRRGDTNLLAVCVIQPRSMLVAVPFGTSVARRSSRRTKV